MTEGNHVTKPAPPVEAVIFDLDGTVLDTESLVLEVSRAVVERHGKQLTKAAAVKAVGMRPHEAWAAVAGELGIQATAEQLFQESEPLLQARWCDAPLLPGALRLLRHLRRHGVAVALATSSSRATLARKLSTKPEVAEAFSLSICGDECEMGKPHPECFHEASKRLGVPPERCLVIEDAPAGIEAATAAGMRVIAVPSMLSQDGTLPHVYPSSDAAARAGCVSLLPSLLDFRADAYGLPAFDDMLPGGAVPMDVVWRLRGTVVKGFGRGSKELGIPTANVDTESLRGTLSQAVTGIYSGWASVGGDPAVYKMAMSVGWNPVFGNQEKTCEPWILHDFGRDFHGEEIRLVVCCWLRPEAAFTSVEALVEQIRRDGDVTRAALEVEALRELAGDPFLRPMQRTEDALRRG